MKRKIIASMLFILMFGLAASAKDQDVDFKAPAIDSISNAEYPELGAIVLDATHSIFYGNIGTPTSPTWLSLGGHAPTMSIAVGSASDSGNFDHSTGYYTAPSGVLYIEIEMIGGGGGGAGSGTANSGPSGSNGTASTFGTFLTASYGSGAPATTGGVEPGGAGGAPSISTPAVGQGWTGAPGASGIYDDASMYVPGGVGASSPFGGAGGTSVTSTTHVTAQANTGSGGGGGGGAAVLNIETGGGGGAGAYIKVIVQNPSGTYAYSVGSGGSGGSAGSSGNAGGQGGSGIIIVKEHYE